MPLLRRTLSSTRGRPPSYASRDDSDSPPQADPPPFHGFPLIYQTGRYRVDPFVSPGDIECHLLLLAAFRKLRETVGNADTVNGNIGVELDSKARWAVFVQVAVYRFEVLVRALKSSATELGTTVLPLDVALVLHAYMLNPLRYDEDCVRWRGETSLRLPDGADLRDVVPSIDKETLLQRSPSQQQLRRWAELTGQPWDPMESFATTCGRPLLGFDEFEHILAPWVTPEGTGYAQQGFKIRGPRGLTLTHEMLGVTKFVQDYVMMRQDAENPSLQNPAVLAGTVTSSLSAPDSTYAARRALWIRERLSQHLGDVKTPLVLATLLGWSQDGMRRTLREALYGRERGVNKIMACYTRGEPFSLDLGMAVLRQGSFIDKMHELGWLQPNRFAVDDTLLQRCIARYHAFVDLMASSPSSFCVPTLDIDLAWHTHQIGPRYKSSICLTTGRFIDHDDKVEEGALSTGFDATARAWKTRFGVPYSTCGCPLPSQPPLSRLSAKLGLSNSAQKAYPAGLLASDAPSAEDHDATHPSTHNALTLPGHPEAQRYRAERAAELEARRKRDERARTKTGTKGERLPAYEERAGDGERRTATHAYAFLAPIPLVPVYYGPMGYPAPAGGCAATDGNHACAPDAAACGGGSGAFQRTAVDAVDPAARVASVAAEAPDPGTVVEAYAEAGAADQAPGAARARAQADAAEGVAAEEAPDEGVLRLPICGFLCSNGEAKPV